MKVTCILGSPRRNGNTAQVLEWVEEQLKAKGHQVDHIHLYDYDISGCRECYECRESPDAPGCTQEDDVNSIFLRMISADAIILASPLLCWDFSAGMKMLLERFYSLVSGYGGDEWKSLVEGRRFGLVVTAAGPVENNMDLIQDVFKREVRWAKGVNAGQLLVPFCSTPEELDLDIRRQASEFADTITMER